MTSADQVIRSEHCEINLVARSLYALARALDEERWHPDFAVLFLILDCIESFPATFHHPKEEYYLFEAIRRRCLDAAPLLDELYDDHAEGLGLVGNLRQSLETYETCPAARIWFHNAAKSYARHERAHIRREERTVLPLAHQVLSTEEWDEINRAFEGGADPILGASRRDNFEKLFARILRTMPGAVVFGSRGKKMTCPRPGGGHNGLRAG